MIKLMILTLGISFGIAAGGAANPTPEAPPVKLEKQEKKVKYKQTKNLNFDSHTVEGQIYRPDLSVVTGDTWLQENSILRMRKTWLDKVAIEYGEGNDDFNTK